LYPKYPVSRDENVKFILHAMVWNGLKQMSLDLYLDFRTLFWPVVCTIVGQLQRLGDK
jgi:hypothetical protein